MDSKKVMQKFTIKGLDCAQCASDIEGALRKIEGFEDASVSFATETVVLPAGEQERAAGVIRRVEPGARLVKRTSTRDQAAGSAPRDGEGEHKDSGAPEPDASEMSGWRVARIAIAVVLTGAGIAAKSVLHETPYHFAEYAVFLPAYLLAGAPVLASAVRNIIRGRMFDEMFLMSVATLGAIVIHQLPEAVAVMLFYSVGEYVQDLAVGRSRRSISSLMDLRPDSVRLLTDNGVQEVHPEEVAVGSVIETLPGERVPLDGEVTEGESAVDTSALTGESVPRTVSIGDTVLSGYVNESGKLRIRTSRAYADSSVSRILELVENAAARKAPTERFISRVASIYTPIMVAIAAAVAFLPPLLVPGEGLQEWVYRALVVLVISCPCALVISIPLGYFGGIGAASRNGILIKGANYLDVLKDVTTVVLDKTGTLTRGVFQVSRVVPRNGYSREELLQWAARAEAHSTHPIARSIRQAFGGEIDADSVRDVREDKGYGISATVYGKNVLAGSDRLMHREEVEHGDCNASGTVVYVAVDSVYVGHLVIADELRPEAASAVTALRNVGVRQVVMFTGDNTHIAARIAGDLGLDSYHAELLPQDKVTKLEELQERLLPGERLAFVGDGINDAPVLMRSDVGFAMGALGSDAAIEAADVVLMEDRVDRISRAMEISRYTRKIVMQNIVLALGIKAVFLGLGAAGIATMWEAVIADVGVSLAAVLNATRTLRVYRNRK